MIADLKKENFDLKLRLYHLEDLMTKELDIYQLNDEVLFKSFFYYVKRESYFFVTNEFNIYRTVD